MKISDINKRDNLELVTDSQDVKFFLDHIGKPELYPEIEGLFVKVGEGELEELYGFSGTIAYNHKQLQKLL